MSTQISTARVLADLAYDVSFHERCWREGNHGTLGSIQARIDRGVDALSRLVGDNTAHEICRALIEAAAANRSDSVACRKFDERVNSSSRSHPFARDLTRDAMREFVADHED